MSEASISVVVPAHRGGEELRQCLDALAGAWPRPLEVLLVADGPAAGIRQLGERAGVKVVTARQKAGPAAARNRGASLAKGEILLFVDSDVVVPADLIGRVDELFRRQPEFAGFIGSYDTAPGAANFLSQYRNLLHHYIHQSAREEASTFWGACGAIRRDEFLAVGGFDERRYVRPCVEDIELGYRLRRAGLRIRLCKELQVRHLKRWSARTVLATDLLDRALPWTELLLETGQWADDLNLRHGSRLSTGLAGGLLLSAIGTCATAGVEALVAANAAGLALLNLGLYGFFLRQRGPVFAAAAIPWHWLHLLCAGTGFAAGCASHMARRFLGKPRRSGHLVGLESAGTRMQQPESSQVQPTTP